MKATYIYFKINMEYNKYQNILTTNTGKYNLIMDS